MDSAACYFVDVMEPEGAAIARGLRQRDPDLLDRLIEQYQHRLLRYLVYLTGNRELSEDIFQDTWLRVLERGRQYNGRTRFEAWLFAIARHLVIDHSRRKKASSLEALTEPGSGHAVEFAGHAPSALEVVAQLQQGSQVMSAVARLEPIYREVLMLRFHEELTLEEIAGVVEAPLSTVKSRLYRGLEALRPLLKESP